VRRPEVNAGHLRVAERWGDIIDMPIKVMELETAAQRGTGNKAPGGDGIGLHFSRSAEER